MGTFKKRLGNYRSPEKWSNMTEAVVKSLFITSNKRRMIENKAIEDLVQDIYLGILPFEMRPAAKIKSGYMVREIKEFLKKKFGNYEIAYSNGLAFPFEIPYGSICIEPELYLVPKKVAMPLWEYLNWHAINERPKVKKVIYEWTGIPPRKQEEIYWKIIYFFRDELQKEHCFEDQYNRSSD